MSDWRQVMGQHNQEDDMTSHSEQGGPSRTRRATLQRTSHFDCAVCFKMLCDPVTTPCGHSFCRQCVFRCLDHDNKCALCRAILPPIRRNYVLSATLTSIVQNSFPEEYAKRKAEEDALAHRGGRKLALHVMDMVLPLKKLSILTDGPEFRLMIRRIMDGSHRMGIVVADQYGNFEDDGCEVEICECEEQADGEFLLQVIGRRRFHYGMVIKKDGYLVSREIEWYSDVCFPDGTRESKNIQELATKAVDLACSLISFEEDATRTGRPSDADILSQAKGMPDPQEDVESFSFWFANLVNLGATERLELLQLTDTRVRIAKVMVNFRAQYGCPIQ